MLIGSVVVTVSFDRLIPSTGQAKKNSKIVFFNKMEGNKAWERRLLSQDNFELIIRANYPCHSIPWDKKTKPFCRILLVARVLFFSFLLFLPAAVAVSGCKIRWEMKKEDQSDGWALRADKKKDGKGRRLMKNVTAVA